MPELASVIDDYLRDAEAHAAGREELRRLRRDLAHVASQLGDEDAAAVRGGQLASLLDDLRDEGVPPERLASIAGSVQDLYAYAVDRGLVDASPLPWPAAAPPPLAGGGDAPARTPTDAMLALGEQAATWGSRLIVLAFALVVLGLALVLV